jgi:hypothetical protein
VVKRNPKLDWNRFLDGGTYVLNLEDIGWERGLNDLRAKIHYEADKRRAVAHTRKIDALTLEFYVVNSVKIIRPTHNCNCGGGAKGPHVITCAALHDWPTPGLDEDHPDYVPLIAAPPSRRQASTPQPQQQQQPQTSDEDYEPLTPEEEEALLGPCTCGQAPVCLPTCARAGG